MLIHYLTTSLTYFKTHKSLLSINLIGLTTALTVCYFAFLYVNFEASYDAYHKNADDIYRLITDVKTSAGIDYRGTSALLAPAVKDAFPEVQAATRILLDYLIIQNETGVQSEEKVGYADSTLFSVFTFPLINGNPKKVLNSPFDVVLTQSCAAKYFGSDNPIGKSLLINGKDRAYVTGVMQDIPSNSHFRVDMLVSMSTLLQVWNPSLAHNWKSRRANTYLLLHKNADLASLNLKITRLLKAKIDQADIEYITSLEPLRRIYLYGKARGSRAGSTVTGNSDNLYMCALGAALVLFIACLNFINISTAFSMQRAKEIAVKKLLGASRSRLIFQFLTDALILSVIVFLLSSVLIIFVTPLFNQISGKAISSGVLEHPEYLANLLLAALTIGILSGLYPAFFQAAFHPMEGLKGWSTPGSKGFRLRQVLVTSQFVISFMLIVATTVLYKQLNFMQSQQLGFKKDHMLAIDFQFDRKAGSEFTRNQLLTIPGVSAASFSSALPGRLNHKLETRIEAKDGTFEPSNIDAYFTDFDFMNQYELKIAAGRAFSSSLASDSMSAMIINVTTAKALGYINPEEALGKRYSQFGREGLVIGIVQDFHFQSFREEIQPLTFQVGELSTFLTLTIGPGDVPRTISLIEEKWKSVVPGTPLSYFFTDDAYNAQYEAETRFGQLFVCVVAVAIVISCLGLLGLSAFNSILRTKEIGIRKLLGSSVFGILKLMTLDFLKLMAIAVLIGIPLAWYAETKWLQGFAYRIPLNFWIFISAALVVMTLAMVTVCLQTMKAAGANPATSLRSE